MTTREIEPREEELEPIVPAKHYIVLTKAEAEIADAKMLEQYLANVEGANGTGMGGWEELKDGTVAMPLPYPRNIKYFADCEVKDKRGKAVVCDAIFTEKQRTEKAVERILPEQRKPVEPVKPVEPGKPVERI